MTLGIDEGSGQNFFCSLVLLHIGGDWKGFFNNPGAHFFEVLARNFKTVGLPTKWQLISALITSVTSSVEFLPVSALDQSRVIHSGSYTEKIFGSSLNRFVRNVVPERSSPKITKLRLFSGVFVVWSTGVIGCDVPRSDDGFAVSLMDFGIFSERPREWSVKQIGLKQEQGCLPSLPVCSSLWHSYTKWWLFRAMNVDKAPIRKTTAPKKRKRKRNRTIRVWLDFNLKCITNIKEK